MNEHEGDVLRPRSFEITNRSATISDCGLYRYDLWRRWEVGRRRMGYVVFIGLNPSTADGTNDDPTIRKCIKYAQNWGYDALCMLNLFAFRATQPKDMLAAADPVGPDNDDFIRMFTPDAGMVVAAWGVDGGYKDRDHHIRDIFPKLYCLGRNNNGTPKHPLYLSDNARAIPL